MIGAEPSYDDILREKKRVEAELRWKEDDYNKTLKRHKKVHDKLLAKQNNIKFDSRSAKEVAYNKKLAEVVAQADSTENGYSWRL